MIGIPSVHKIFRWGLVSLGLLSAGLLASCDKGDTAKGPVGTTIVAMADNTFSPPIAHVPVGASIVFHNAGRNPHNAIAVDGSWSSEKTFGNISMGPDTMTEVSFSKPGVYPYYCSFHGTPDGKFGMVGVVVVGDAKYIPESAGRSNLKPVAAPTGVVRHVPKDYTSIQSAVDSANPGDLILVDKGVYNEQVFVTTPGITIRGVDRNDVILEGNFEYSNGIMVSADGVTVENMTARHYTLNGFYWTGIKGFRGSYLTAYNNGDYGIYAFGASDGVFDHDYASGSPDSAFYVGQCNPCRAVLDHVTGEYSGLGYSGTNSSGDMYIINSTFTRNRSGIGTTALDVELLPPGHATTIVGNNVSNNGGTDAAAFSATASITGFGIMLGGTDNNIVSRNYVSDNQNYGIMAIALNDRHFWPSIGNVIRENVVRNSGRADLGTSGPGAIGNCFEGNSFATSMPWGLQIFNNCKGPRIPIGSELSSFMTFWAGIAKGRDNLIPIKPYKDMPVPAPQINMPGGATAPVVPAIHPFEDYKLNINAITVPVPQKAAAQTGERRG